MSLGVPENPTESGDVKKGTSKIDLPTIPPNKISQDDIRIQNWQGPPKLKVEHLVREWHLKAHTTKFFGGLMAKGI